MSTMGMYASVGAIGPEPRPRTPCGPIAFARGDGMDAIDPSLLDMAPRPIASGFRKNILLPTAVFMPKYTT